MTHVNTNKSLHAIKRALIFAGIGVLTHLSVGCTSTNNTLTFPGLNSNAADAAAQAEAGKQLAISQLVGAPPNVAKTLSGALVKAATDRKIALSENKTDKSDYLLQGYLVADSTAKGTKLSYIWDVSDAQGKRAHRIKGEELVSATPVKKGTDPWTLVNDKIIESVATKTAARIATWLPTQKPAEAAPMLVSDNKKSGTTGSTGTVSATNTKTAKTAPTTAKKPSTTKVAAKPTKTVQKPKVAAAKPIPTKKATQPVKTVAQKVTPKPAQPEKVVALVPTVLGAPGDGQTSLTSAIKKQLDSRGVSLATNGVQNAAYTVRGEVKLTPASQTNKEDIAIEWRVIDPTGKKLGTVSQRNSIPKGSLNGAWGRTADAAAAAAAEGIVKLLPKK